MERMLSYDERMTLRVMLNVLIQSRLFNETIEDYRFTIKEVA